jgi:HSP20 family molecular chaperone IbpA
VQMDLAGMEPTGIEVWTDGHDLLIRGIRQDIAPAGKKHFFKMEISVGPFIRRVTIPVEVDLKNAVATYRNGFLYVTFHKGLCQDQARRKIAVD